LWALDLHSTVDPEVPLSLLSYPSLWRLSILGDMWNGFQRERGGSFDGFLKDFWMCSEVLRTFLRTNLRTILLYAPRLIHCFEVWLENKFAQPLVGLNLAQVTAGSLQKPYLTSTNVAMRDDSLKIGRCGNLCRRDFLENMQAKPNPGSIKCGRYCHRTNKIFVWRWVRFNGLRIKCFSMHETTNAKTTAMYSHAHTWWYAEILPHRCTNCKR
jgi:hypothetical protein